jgi:hypothetical protein
MSASTLLEALTAELLGDVTALTEQVNQLKSMLPSICEEAAIAASMHLQIHLGKALEDYGATGLGERQLAGLLEVEGKAKRRIEEHAHRLGEQKTKLVRNAIWEAAHDVFNEMRREATRRVSMRWKCQWLAAMATALLIAMAAGFSLGATYKTANVISMRDDVLKDKPPGQIDPLGRKPPKPKLGRSIHDLKKP